MAMKVLYVGHFLEASGFSIAAENYVKALLSANIDVVCRNVKLSPVNNPPLSSIAHLFDKSVDGITHVIQHLLPHHMSQCEGMHNIGLCVYDFSSLDYVGWHDYLSCMDEVWFPSQYDLSRFRFPPSVKVNVAPHTFDTSKYNNEYTPLDVPELGGECVFYTIGTLDKRKNLRDTIIAFNSEFHSNEPVSLVIKTSKFGVDAQECARVVTDDINRIKSGLKLYPDGSYKPEVLITHSLTDDQIGSIHQTGYCYVNSSKGEAWNMSQMDSWGHGNNVIYYTDQSQRMYSYLYGPTSDELLFPVECPTEPCFGFTDTFQQLGTTREKCLGSNISGLMRQMRAVYDKWRANSTKLKHNDYEAFSYESVGKKMKGLLEGSVV